MEKQILSGNEAVARGAYEAGCAVAAAYPGTPSTEILENVALYKDDIYCQWACNEKVAAEIAAGAAIGGARALAAMKHVGMNVAADPIFSMAYAGVNGGLVVVSADDPGCHSSQNEQDNRLFAPHAKIGLLEPSDSQECKDFTKLGFELSERFDVPMLLRMTTRICHSKSAVTLEEREDVAVKPYRRDIKKYALMPSHARIRHIDHEALLIEMEAYANECPVNYAEYNPGAKAGVITSGISYQYAREVFGDTVSYLKLGLTYPLPRKLITEFAEKFETLYVVEENDPYLETAIRALGFTNVIGKERIPICGELNTQIVREGLLGIPAEAAYEVELDAPARPPVMCAGCGYRGFFYALSRKLKRFVSVGDIGCYGLGVNPPLSASDYSLCMGAGLSSTIGLSKALALQGDSRKVLGMVGDSTFFHSGLNSLIDVVSSNANVVACVLNNHITAMTGHQQNPGTEINLMGEPNHTIDLVKLIRATDIGDERIRVVDPLDLAAVNAALDEAAEIEGPFVIVTSRPCALLKEVVRANAGKYCEVDEEKCRGCKKCLQIACPAISFVDKKAVIAQDACNGCGLCLQMCNFDAISKVGE